MRNRAIFLDRDGTVIRGIQRPEFGRPSVAYGPWHMNELTFEPNLRETMKIFHGFGYLTALVTNQPDVAYGKLPQRRWEQIFATVLREMQPNYAYWCLHPRGAGCECKKPKPGMLLRAALEHKINLKKSWMIGDTENDMLAGKAAGCKTILIRRSYNLDNKEANENADCCVRSLLEATVVV